MREYNVGLPALLRVMDDGSLEIEVYLSDLDHDLDDCADTTYSDSEVESDQAAVTAALWGTYSSRQQYAITLIDIPSPHVGN